MTSKKLPLVWVLGAGGTIASSGSHRLEFVEYGRGGKPLDIKQNLERIPEVKEFADVKAEHLVQIGPSANTGAKEWLAFAKRINQLFRDEPETAGVVLTHGTNTLEETAYFLNLTAKSDKPVVVTGSMRPISALGTEGDNNLLNAIILAGSPEARGKGAVIMLNDEIQAAREGTKTNSYRVETFQTRELGSLGYVDSDHKVVFYRAPTRKHTHQTEFDVSNLTDLPRVDVVYAVSGGDGLLIRSLIEHKVPGIVSAGTGAGTGSSDYEAALAEAHEKGAVVVTTTRTGAGRNIQTSRHRERGIVAGDNLNPQKARILLMLALSVTKDMDRIQEMFNTY